MDRERMTDTLVDDLEAWLKRDAEGFWDHIRDLERKHLRVKSDKKLSELYKDAL